VLTLILVERRLLLDLILAISAETAIDTLLQVSEQVLLNLCHHYRKYMYLGFGKLYGVNFDEIKVDDIN
jgi:hypothetical protein